MRGLLRTMVLSAQALLIIVYAAFFSMVPALLDNPENHRGNMLFFIPVIALVASLLGFFFPRLSAVLMIGYALAVYTALVLLDKGHLSSFGYALGPAWPPLVAAGALFWAAKLPSGRSASSRTTPLKPIPGMSGPSACDDFTECLSQFVGAGATWEVERNKQKTGSDVVVKIVPRSEKAAPIDARLELDFGIYLLFGIAAQFEIPFSKTHYSGSDWLTELDMLCHAVANGHFEERVIYVGDKAVFSEHQLVLGNGKTVREHWGIRPLFPWKKTRTVEHHYAAYSSRSADAGDGSSLPGSPPASES